MEVNKSHGTRSKKTRKESVEEAILNKEQNFRELFEAVSTEENSWDNQWNNAFSKAGGEWSNN